MSPQGERLAGREIAGYRLLHLLGTGGASEVYLGQHIENPAALVAVKVLLPAWQLPPEARASFHARFLREAQAAQRLQHPHILPVLSYGEEGDVTYMVLPFMPGGTLADRLTKTPHGLPLAEAGTYLAQLADALDFAHAQGVVHRDLKPSNVLVDDHDQLFLADLGIARLFDPAEGATRPAGGQPLTTLTVTGQVLGTPVYMAPEQLASGRVTPAADIYALGILLYQMVTGAAPFQAETPIGLAMQHVQEAPPLPRARRLDLPAPAEAAILRALAKSPEARFASAGALSRAFAAGLRGEWTEGLAPTNTSATPPGLSPTVVATPPPTIMAPPTPYPAYPAGAAPTPYPGGAMPYMPPGSYPLPAPPRRSGGGAAVFAVVALVAVLVAGLGAYGTGLLRFGGGNAGTPPGATTPTSRTSSGPTAKALVPVGSLLYATAAGGACDSRGAQWARNTWATQSCEGGALVMSAGECDCPIGVATLRSIPGVGYPRSFVAQVSVEAVGSAPDAKMGFKFRQQSIQDSGNGRGGYSFLVDPNGQWQFNLYDADGTRHILVQNQHAPVRGVNTLDLVVDGATFSFYFNGTHITTQTETTYASGYFCLAIEPGATVYFRNFALYALP